MTVTATEFDVESHSSCEYDSLTIGGSKYCGSVGPQGVTMEAGSTMMWSSDFSVNGAGFVVCSAGATAPTPPSSPPPSPSPASPSPSPPPSVSPSASPSPPSSAPPPSRLEVLFAQLNEQIALLKADHQQIKAALEIEVDI